MAKQFKPESSRNRMYLQATPVIPIHPNHFQDEPATMTLILKRVVISILACKIQQYVTERSK